MSDAERAAAAAQPRVVVGRGPGYPSLPLEEAISRVGQLREANLGRATVSSLAACKVWGWSSEGGDARAVLASLNHYGLMAYVGRGENKQIQLTDLAHRIIFDRVPNSQERLAALQEAALNPTNFKKVWDKYGGGLPPDFVIETYLVRDLKFSDSGARTFIASYRPTLEYAGLGQPANMPFVNDGGAKADPAREEIEVGDLIQVEIDGALALPKPDRVRAIQEHEGRRWVFIETSETGIPMEQATLVEKGIAGEVIAPKAPPKLPLAARGSDAPSDDHDAPFAPWTKPTDKDWDVRLIGDRLQIKASVDVKGLRRLVRILKANELLLSTFDEIESEEQAHASGK